MRTVNLAYQLVIVVAPVINLNVAVLVSDKHLPEKVHPNINWDIRRRFFNCRKRGGPRTRGHAKNHDRMLLLQTGEHELRRRGRAVAAGHRATRSEGYQKLF